MGDPAKIIQMIAVVTFQLFIKKIIFYLYRSYWKHDILDQYQEIIVGDRTIQKLKLSILFSVKTEFLTEMFFFHFQKIKHINFNNWISIQIRRIC